MPTLARGRPSGVAGRQTQGFAVLPEHEPPSHPLNQIAQNALQDLPRNHKLDSLKNRLQAANDHLTQAAADINDRLHANVERHEKLKKRREAVSSQGSNAVDDEEVNKMRHDTDDMTSKLDQKVRDIIDARARVANVEKALRELDTNSSNNRGVIAPTQSTIGASQSRGFKRRRLGGEVEEDEDDSGAPIESMSVVEGLKRNVYDYEEEYKAASLAVRYAAQPNYVGFKKIVHDARHPGDNAPPLPHTSTWFSKAANRTMNDSFAGGNQTQNDEDDDFQVASERISTKCSITLRTMKDPYQSTKCPHNFEKEAILEMINLSDTRAPRDGHRGAGQKAMKCPECEILLTSEDLQPNAVLLRKIKRIQAAEQAQNEESENEDIDVNQSALSTREEGTSSPTRTAASIKRERVSQAQVASMRDTSMVPDTQL